MPAKSKIECPVCGMKVREDAKLKTEHKGLTYYFCSKGDMKAFQMRPQVYSWKAQHERAGKASKAA